MIEFILDNSYATYGGQLYKQNKGIPQGNNASPQIADLTLSYMEYEYISTKIKAGHPLSHHLTRTFRYIDDLLHVSSKTDEFIRATAEMYHSSLTLERTNAQWEKAAFLDLNLEIQHGKITSSLYNKTDDYTFKVIRYPQFASNIPLRIGLNTFHGEIVRIHRVCSASNHFIARVRQLIANFVENGYDKNLIIGKMLKTLSRNPFISLKYSITNGQLAAEIVHWQSQREE